MLGRSRALARVVIPERCPAHRRRPGHAGRLQAGKQVCRVARQAAGDARVARRRRRVPDGDGAVAHRGRRRGSSTPSSIAGVSERHVTPNGRSSASARPLRQSEKTPRPLGARLAGVAHGLNNQLAIVAGPGRPASRKKREGQPGAEGRRGAASVASGRALRPDCCHRHRHGAEIRPSRRSPVSLNDVWRRRVRRCCCTATVTQASIELELNRSLTACRRCRADRRPDRPGMVM